VDLPVPAVVSFHRFRHSHDNGTVSLHIEVTLIVFVLLTFALGAVFAFGMASTFKYVADDFAANMGVVTGIVGLAGGLGGFLLPIIFGVLLDVLKIRSTCFMFLYGIVWVSLILIYLSEVRRTSVVGRATG
jgi:NNP family nitrate/nitrite transporter-like MFS transporter